jgi:pilus assembly protein CpaB
VTAATTRRRGLVLLALSLASGGLAASQVHQRARAVEAQVGPAIAVAVAARDLPADAPLGAQAVESRQVPARYVPPGALDPRAANVARRTIVPVPAGTVITTSQLEGGAPAGGRGGLTLRRGERALELAAAGGDALAGAAPGAHVDVVVSRESGGGGGSTFMALEDVELLGLRAASESATAGLQQDDEHPASAVATLRVTARQAVYLTAAQNFGREVRLLVRPAGDRRRAGSVEVGANDL